MKIMQSIAASRWASLALCTTVMAQDAKPKQSVLITNARIFDGQHEALATGMSVLVGGNKIVKIAKSIKAPEEGAYADLLLTNGDPLKDISILTKPDKNLSLIMKDGKIYKNTVK